MALFTCFDVSRRSTRTIVIAVCFLAASSIKDVSAQDTHYWTQQYGTQGELLLGTVVGSLIDLSAMYYNPGALALHMTPCYRGKYGLAPDQFPVAHRLAGEALALPMLPDMDPATVDQVCTAVQRGLMRHH